MNKQYTIEELRLQLSRFVPNTTEPHEFLDWLERHEPLPTEETEIEPLGLVWKTFVNDDDWKLQRQIDEVNSKLTEVIRTVNSIKKQLKEAR